MSKGAKKAVEAKGFWAPIWANSRRPAQASLEDLLQGILLWMSIAIIHAIQGKMLTFGWSPQFVKVLTFAEEWTVEVTVIGFLLFSAIRFVFGLLKKGLEGAE